MLPLFGRAAAYAFSFLFCINAASASGLLTSLSSSETRVAAMEAAPRDSLVKRSRVAKLDLSELGRHIAPLGLDTAADRVERAEKLDGVITVALFPDAVATFQRKGVGTMGDSGFVWTGEVANRGPSESASLIVENGEITGHIQLDDRIFQITPLANGLHRVSELDPGKFPPDHPPHARYSQPFQSAQRLPITANPEAGTTVRVLIAYTREAAAQAKTLYGGANPIVAQAKLAIALANTAYVNSKIPLNVVLAKAMSVGAGFSEKTSLQQNLYSLDGRNGTDLANVRAAREAVSADLVVLLQSSQNAGGGCGFGNGTDNPSNATNYVAFSAVNLTCIGNYSVTHEMGHNMGLRHDRLNDSAPGVGYNFGYTSNKAGCQIYDIMAYYYGCGSSACKRVNMFSSGTVKYQNGSKLCVIGIKKGLPKAADGALRVKETKGAIAGYR
jgi:hypothetical protein